MIIKKISLKAFASKVVLAVFIISLFVGLTSTGAFAKSDNLSNSNNSDKRVIVFSLPRVTWKELIKVDTPNIDKLISAGSIASMSVKTLGSVANPAEGYATISAGSRAAIDQSYGSSYLKQGESYSGRDALDIYTEQRGTPTIKNAVALGLGFEKSLNANEKSLNISKLGSFADALHKGKKTIAVFGNADKCLDDSSGCFGRSIGYLGTDKNGIVRYGDLSRELLEKTNDSLTTLPSLDNDVVATKVKDSLKSNDVNVVECSDLERIESTRNVTKDAIANKNFSDAIVKCDELIGKILPSISLTKDQVYVIAASSPRSLAQTTVFIAAGNGILQGYATSSTTRQQGLVSLVDISPTILKFLGVAKPDVMSDTLLDWQKDGSSNEARQKFLVKINNQAITREGSLTPIMWSLVTLFSLTVLVSMIAFTRRDKFKKIARFLSLMTFTFPLVTYILQPISLSIQDPFKYVSSIVFVCLILSIFLTFIGNKYGYAKAILFFAAAYLFIQIIDIAFGGTLQFNTVFGNATIVAGRFAGWGNSSFAFMSIFTIVFVAMVKEVTQKVELQKTKKINLFLLFSMFIVLIFDGAPYFGSDVGGVLALTPAFFFLSMMLYERRVGIKAVFLSTVITVTTITIFALVDLSRPVAERTHLGRFANSLKNGEAGITIERKMAASIYSFHRPVLVVISIMTIIYFVFIALSKNQYFKKTYELYLGLKFIVIPALIVAVLGTLLNDSGLSIPAMSAVIVIPVFTLLAFDIKDEKTIES